MNTSRPENSTRSLSHAWEPGLWLVLLAGMNCSGCSDSSAVPRVAARGSVLINGEPLDAGVIRLIPMGSNTGPGAVAEVSFGEFEFAASNGPVPGELRVEIEEQHDAGFELDDEATFARMMREGGRIPFSRNTIPPRYNTSSELRVTLSREQSAKLEFHLQVP